MILITLNVEKSSNIIENSNVEFLKRVLIIRTISEKRSSIYLKIIIPFDFSGAKTISAISSNRNLILTSSRGLFCHRMQMTKRHVRAKKETRKNKV